MGGGITAPGAGPVVEPVLNQVGRMREVLALSWAGPGDLLVSIGQNLFDEISINFSTLINIDTLADSPWH